MNHSLRRLSQASIDPDRKQILRARKTGTHPREGMRTGCRDQPQCAAAVDGFKHLIPIFVITRFMRVTQFFSRQLGRPDEPGDDEKWEPDH
jgi:hypothetical protein